MSETESPTLSENQPPPLAVSPEVSSSPETETAPAAADIPAVSQEAAPAQTGDAPLPEAVAAAETAINDAPTDTALEKPAVQPQNKHPKRGKKRKASAEGKEKNRDKNPGKGRDKSRDKNQDPSWVSYQPADIIKRMQSKRSIWDAYMEDANALSLQIRQWGLGASLAVLLAQTQSKRKRRLYWDLSKWMLKERKLKGKNSRSLIESVLYGDAFYLLRATEASLGFLEEILFLGQQKAYQPLSGKEKAPSEAETAREGNAPAEVNTVAEEQTPPEAETVSEVATADAETTPEAETAPAAADISAETPPDQNDETRSAPVHA